MRNAIREPRHDEVFTRIEAAIKEKNISQQKFIQDLKINPCSYTKWKYENGKSYMKYISQIADYLGVSVLYLLKGCKEISYDALSDQETDLIKEFRTIPKEQKEIVLSLIRSMNQYNSDSKTLS